MIVTTNAAGVLENGMIEKGDVALVDADYVNQFGANPWMGPNDDRLGTRFQGKKAMLLTLRSIVVLKGLYQKRNSTYWNIFTKRQRAIL